MISLVDISSMILLNLQFTSSVDKSGGVSLGCRSLVWSSVEHDTVGLRAQVRWFSRYTTAGSGRGCSWSAGCSVVVSSYLETLPAGFRSSSDTVDVEGAAALELGSAINAQALRCRKACSLCNRCKQLSSSAASAWRFCGPELQPRALSSGRGDKRGA